MAQKPMNPPRFYRRNLPHIQPEGVLFDVNFCLEGSLPAHVVRQLQDERDQALQEIEHAKNKGETELVIATLEKEADEIRDRYLHKFDDLLDERAHGPDWLRQESIAGLVMESLHFLETESKDWHLICYCIMPNHVHVMMSDCQRVLHQILKSHKQYVGLRANRLLGRSGRFWHRESFDRVVRSPREFQTRLAYNLNNPVKAGLVTHWEDWPYTYCAPEYL